MKNKTYRIIGTNRRTGRHETVNVSAKSPDGAMLLLGFTHHRMVVLDKKGVE